MGTDIEKLIDLMIQERMQNQFAKWRKAETDKEKKADYLHLETEYEKAISALSEEQKEAVRHYCDSIFDSGTESECFFYRLGLKDGIRLWKFMKKLMKRSANRCTTAYFIPPTNGAKAVQRYRLGGFFSTCASSLGAYNTAVVWFCPAYYLGF